MQALICGCRCQVQGGQRRHRGNVRSERQRHRRSSCLGSSSGAGGSCQRRPQRRPRRPRQPRPGRRKPRQNRPGGQRAQRYWRRRRSRLCGGAARRGQAAGARPQAGRRLRRAPRKHRRLSCRYKLPPLRILPGQERSIRLL